MTRPWVVTLTLDMPVVAETAAAAEEIALDHAGEALAHLAVDTVIDATRHDPFEPGTLPWGTDCDEPFADVIARTRRADERAAELKRVQPDLFSSG